MSFDDFERQVMSHILREQTEQNIRLLQQYDTAKIVSREFTGCGFFTDFSISNETLALPGNGNIELGCLGELEGVEHGVGFILFVRNGIITVLEGFVYTGAWPEVIGNFQLMDSGSKPSVFNP